MSEEMDEYIARVNKILTNSNKENISENSHGKVAKAAGKTKIKTKNKQNVGQLLNYKTLGQLESLCKRALVLHTKGIYMRPPEDHACNKKKRQIGGKKVDRGPAGKMPKTTFGSGSVGVSCESYGVKNCTCCAPRNHDDIQLIQEIQENIHRNDMLYKHLRLAGTYNEAPSDYIDLTDTYEFDQSSCSKYLDNSVINITDSSLNNTTIMIPDDDDDDDLPELTKSADNINLPNKINTEKKNESTSNLANVECITDYINLVTTDFDENELMDYEEELVKTMETDEPQPVNKKTPTIASNSPTKICCPICLESFANKEVMSTICGHLFCADCIRQTIKRTKSCPNCRKELTLKSIHPIYLN